MSMRKHFILIYVLISGFGSLAIAQSDSLRVIRSNKDSLAKANRANKDSISTYLDKKPRTALFLGLLLPGAGQAFNKRWWKLPLAYGAYGFAVYRIDATRKLYNEWDGYFQEAVATGGKVMVAPGIDWDSRQIKAIRDRLRDDKDRAVFLMIGIHLLTSLEAFVDAHLKNFNIDDDLGVIFNSPSAPGPALGFTYRLH